MSPPDGIDGRSFLPLLQGRAQSAHPHLYWEFPAENPGHGDGSPIAARAGRWKAIRTRVEVDAAAPVQLYDLQTDPGETSDVAAAHPERVEQFHGIFRREHRPSAHFNSWQ